MTEQIRVDGFRLGRRPPSDKPTLKASAFLRAGAVPAVPDTVDHLSGVTFDLGRNDRYGVCGPVSLANYIRMVTAKVGGAMRTPTWEDIKALYVLQNPDFNEQTGAGDGGVDMKTMLSDAVKHGFGTTKVLGFASVDVKNPEEVEAAVAIFGGVLLGLDLEQAQNDQLSSGVWDYVSGSPEWGGHAVLEGAYETTENEDVITWAQRVAMTRRFAVQQRQEAYVVILQDHLDDPQFMVGFDLIKFSEAYQEITGRPFPATIPPEPLPPGPVPPPITPPPVTPPPAPDADDALAQSVHDWVFNKRHSGIARVVADALKAWFHATGRA